MRRDDTATIGDLAEDHAIRLLQDRGWNVTDLNVETRNHRLYDLRAEKDGRQVMISVKHARAKREIRLGSLRVFRDLQDDDFIIIFLPRQKGAETDIERGDYELWLVPGSARHQAIHAHLQYYAMDEARASGHPIMIKDKVDRPGGKSSSGKAFHTWQTAYRDAWHLLDQTSELGR
ncbi:MAG: hypothetical protein JHD15_00720 [Phenylobacterium sp.]|uniref:hypothetical protein n=1 Tax=Phenylobacterium sp. TaxID=1871053 RepID=UPI001A2825F0|nr:hypothetical protein [Phenylobacterium sp.]MBJ7408879.1 hypothetical protein [Phenylobacterium sp.]